LEEYLRINLSLWYDCDLIVSGHIGLLLISSGNEGLCLLPKVPAPVSSFSKKLSWNSPDKDSRSVYRYVSWLLLSTFLTFFFLYVIWWLTSISIISVCSSFILLISRSSNFISLEVNYFTSCIWRSRSVIVSTCCLLNKRHFAVCYFMRS